MRINAKQLCKHLVIFILDIFNALGGLEQLLVQTQCAAQLVRCSVKGLLNSRQQALKTRKQISDPTVRIIFEQGKPKKRKSCRFIP